MGHTSEGKVVAVAGAGRGIGREIALLSAGEASGRASSRARMSARDAVVINYGYAEYA